MELKSFDGCLYFPRETVNRDVREITSNADPDVKALARSLLRKRPVPKRGFGEAAMLELLFRLGVVLNEALSESTIERQKNG